MCYNIFTYKSSPMVIMGMGGFEPPRQFPASRPQIYCACQLHHIPVIENHGEGNSLPANPSPNSHLKDIPKHGHLSIGKTIVNVTNIDDKPITKETHMAVCPKCYSRDMIRFGMYGNKQKWHCMSCGYTTISPRQRRPKKKKKK